MLGANPVTAAKRTTEIFDVMAVENMFFVIYCPSRQPVETFFRKIEFSKVQKKVQHAPTSPEQRQIQRQIPRATSSLMPYQTHFASGGRLIRTAFASCPVSSPNFVPRS